MSDTPTTVLLLHGRSHGDRSEAATQLTALLAGMDVRLRELPDSPENMAVFTAIRSASPTGIPLLAITDPDVEQPFRSARRLVKDLPEVRFLFVVDAAREAALRRDAVFSAPPGGRWQLTDARGETLAAQIAASLETGRQAQRLRTTVDRMKLRLPAQTTVDSIEYRRLVLSDRYLASVLQNAQDAIVSLSPTGSVMAWNRGAQLMFGLSEREARSRPMASLFDDPAAFEAEAAAALERGSASATLATTHDGVHRELEANIDCLVDDHAKAAGLVVILRDVTERNRVEASLHASNRQKDEFLAMLSHELRNPLAPIRNAAQLLQMLDLRDSRATQAAAIIARQATHMTALMDDLLDVARVTRGTVTLDKAPLSIAAVVADALEQTHGAFEAKRQQLTVSRSGDAAEVDGDRKRLTQVLVNLLTNSSKFTPEHGRVRVDTQTTSRSVVLTVSDDGMGIDAELLPHVFDLFVQGSRSSDRALGGLGLGLALVRTLVELHGGTVAMSSGGAGLGTSVRIELPRVVTTAALPLASTAPVAAHPLRLVAVDDNADAVHTLASLLETLGHRVDAYTDPRRALERLSAPLPDAMILDIGMPHLDGYALARQIRAIPVVRQPVLIALTGYGMPGDSDQAFAAGFDHHLVKPLDFAALTTILSTVKTSAAASPRTASRGDSE